MTEERVRDKIELFRKTYIDSYNSPSTQMDLREQFYLVRDESKAIHELMALMYDDIHKVLTDNKTQTLKLLDKAIQSDTELYNYLLTIEKNIPVKKSGIKALFTWSNILKFNFFLGSTLLILFSLYKIDPTAYSKVMTSFMSILKKF